jgi:RNA polymerase sigma-70 factor, ECF subfamily
MYEKNSEIHRAIEEAFRREAGIILASLISSLRDFELAEDALQDALLVALERWPKEGLPVSPGAWITTTARRKAIDRLRRANTLERKQEILQEIQTQEEMTSKNESVFPDDRLKLMFTCCHPALALETQVALTLQTLGGLSTSEIASAFLMPVPTMAQRLVRAKRKIRDAGIPYRIPEANALGERIQAILTVLYLIFNEGYMATSGNELIRQDLCDEAIRLTQVLATLLKEERKLDPEVLGLLALLMLQHARRAGRVGADGELVLLEAQDRSLWKREEIAEGLAVLEKALSTRHAGPFQIQAAISALHAQARSAEETDWVQIAALYKELWRIQPSPVIELNRAVAIAMADGPLAGLLLLEHSSLSKALNEYHLYHATRADLLRRASRQAEAREAYIQALKFCHNAREQTFLTQRLAEVSESSD